MEENYIVLDHHQQKALQALHDFAHETFLGYCEGHGAEEEKDLLQTFQWLVQEYIELIFATSKPFPEMEDWEKKSVYNKLMQCFNPTKIGD